MDGVPEKRGLATHIKRLVDVAEGWQAKKLAIRHCRDVSIANPINEHRKLFVEKLLEQFLVAQLDTYLFIFRFYEHDANQHTFFRRQTLQGDASLGTRAVVEILPHVARQVDGNRLVYARVRVRKSHHFRFARLVLIHLSNDRRVHGVTFRSENDRYDDRCCSGTGSSRHINVAVVPALAALQSHTVLTKVASHARDVVRNINLVRILLFNLFHENRHEPISLNHLRIVRLIC